MIQAYLPNLMLPGINKLISCIVYHLIYARVCLKAAFRQRCVLQSGACRRRECMSGHTLGSTIVPRIQLVLYNRSQGNLGGDDAL